MEGWVRGGGEGLGDGVGMGVESAGKGGRELEGRTGEREICILLSITSLESPLSVSQGAQSPIYLINSER